MKAAHEQHVSPLMAMLYPAYTRRCDHCGGYVAMPAEDVLRQASEAAMEPLAALARAFQQPEGLTGALGLPESPAYGRGGDWREHGGYHDWMHEWGGGYHPGHHHDRCRCRHCGHDDCGCRCCIVNADLVVRARLGERRVLPITIDNDRRREREVSLELSDFTSRGGSPGRVTGEIVPPAEFTLSGCESRDVVIVVDTAGRNDDKPRPKTPAKGDDERDERRPPDVDECEVFYADLRIVGCDNRPVRIAVAILPRDCHSYPVHCGCACCC
jgi:hypothetical protein